ncbi:MAG: diguanylate cyclase [Sulfurimonas sp.]
MHNLKLKIIFIVTFIIFVVSFVVTGYTIIYEKKQSQQRIADAHKSVTTTYNESMNEIVNFFHARANEFISDKEIFQAILNKNHDELYMLTKERWAILQQENPHLIVLQFHNSDGTSLLRVHQPTLYGDDIAKKRETLSEIHSRQKLLYGFEEGRAGFVFRVLVPIFNNEEYIGAIEFGVSAQNLAELIKHDTNLDALFFTHKSYIGKFKELKESTTIGDFISLNMPKALLPLFNKYKKIYSMLDNSFIDFDGHLYYLSTTQIKNYKGNEIGLLVFLNQMDDFEEYIKGIALSSLLITLTLIVIVAIFVHFLYNRISGKMNFQELFNQTVLDAIPSPIIVTDGKELILANQTFLLYFKYKSIDAFKKEHQCVCEYFEEGDTDEFLMPNKDDRIWTEYVFHNPEKNHKVKITINDTTTVFDVKLSVLQYNNAARYVVVFTDISSLQSLSTNDSLTGIANRLHFGMVYEHLISMAKREHSDLGVIFFDIDHFKKINDNHGHLVGDSVLKSISNLVQHKTRKSDIFARWGGEEFIILLPNTPLESCIVIAEGIRLAIANQDFVNSLRVTCSFGVATLRENESSIELIKRVDSLLYEAKELGRNRVVS